MIRSVASWIAFLFGHRCRRCDLLAAELLDVERELAESVQREEVLKVALNKSRAGGA